MLPQMIFTYFWICIYCISMSCGRMHTCVPGLMEAADQTQMLFLSCRMPYFWDKVSHWSRAHQVDDAGHGESPGTSLSSLTSTRRDYVYASPCPSLLYVFWGSTQGQDCHSNLIIFLSSFFFWGWIVLCYANMPHLSLPIPPVTG